MELCFEQVNQPWVSILFNLSSAPIRLTEGLIFLLEIKKNRFIFSVEHIHNEPDNCDR